MATPTPPSSRARGTSAKAAAGTRGATSKASATGTDAYNAAQLMVLEGLEAVRKRPGMYIGSTDGRGLMHCLWEIVDNAVDEALGAHCSRIVVTLHPDGSVEVADNGRGIPVDVEKRTKLSGVEVVFTKLHAGGKFGGGSYSASGGLHGVGASVVNALSSRLDVAVTRGGKVHGASFRRGVAGRFDAEGPDAGFTKAAGLTVLAKAKPTVTGTTVRWWADRQIFIREAELDMAALDARLRQTSFLVPGLELQLRDERGVAPTVTSYLHKGGISEYCEFLARDAAVSPVIRLRGHGHFTETVPVLDAAGHMTPTEVERDVDVDIALRWGGGYETDIRSYVNIIATGKGGTHVAGFERALTKTVNEVLRSTRTLKTSEDAVSKDDICEGLTAVVTVRFAEPQFEGQTKEVLGTPGITRIVSTVVARELAQWFTNPPRGEKAATKLVLEKVANAARARLAARQSRDLQRRKTALGTSALPAKLRDCQTDDVTRSELFIVEGDSALGTAKDARYSDFQALLPIRGKILNVQKSSAADMLKNAECASIIQVIGAGSGRECDPESARYGKIILMSDADVDGAHIRCLLLTLIHRYLRPLLDKGLVFAAVPPLHRIELSGSGGKKPEVRYTYSDVQLQQTLAELEKSGRGWKDPIQRYKGLGEMDARQLRETTMDPASRTLRRINVADAEAASRVFDLLMGSEVPPRKEFIVSGAHRLDRAAIDA
ncbi:MAG: type IIA DNA topoisomerase subunit B [Actinobacteria bacterium]|nr:type IIA DNA topoisomerase subunit B [Actinomycetota bacterium]